MFDLNHFPQYLLVLQANYFFVLKIHKHLHEVACYCKIRVCLGVIFLQRFVVGPEARSVSCMDSQELP